MSQAHPEKHICIFELERKGNSYTDHVVCRICGAYLSSDGHASQKPTLKPDKQESL